MLRMLQHIIYKGITNIEMQMKKSNKMIFLSKFLDLVKNCTILK
jgi:hypothetical protein